MSSKHMPDSQGKAAVSVGQDVRKMAALGLVQGMAFKFGGGLATVIAEILRHLR